MFSKADEFSETNSSKAASRPMTAEFADYVDRVLSYNGSQHDVFEEPRSAVAKQSPELPDVSNEKSFASE